MQLKYIPLFLLSMVSSFLQAQSIPDQWFTDKEKAQIFATENNLDILMVFAGSDWCRPCMKFKKEILESETFSAFAKKELVILYLDFPSKKKNKLSKERTKHHEVLAEKYNLSGVFPLIIQLNEQFDALKTLAFEGQTPEAFIQLLK